MAKFCLDFEKAIVELEEKINKKRDKLPLLKIKGCQ